MPRMGDFTPITRYCRSGTNTMISISSRIAAPATMRPHCNRDMSLLLLRPLPDVAEARLNTARGLELQGYPPFGMMRRHVHLNQVQRQIWNVKNIQGRCQD